ncbi:MAG: hypothetical protein O7D32_11440 [bacterium]|nr:hypothetical protein [bacterium]
MKRLLGILLVVAVVGCGSNESVGDPSGDSVAALEKLEARIERNDRGEVISVDLSATQVSDAELAHLKALASLQILHLFNTQIGDTGLIHLQGMTDLRELGLGRTRITDEGLVHLKDLTSLQTLDFSWCSRITGAGLEHLKELTNLRDLSLYKTKVTDAGLVHLKGMTDLENLALPVLGTSDAGVAELRKSLTKCEINRLDY